MVKVIATRLTFVAINFVSNKKEYMDVGRRYTSILSKGSKSTEVIWLQHLHAERMQMGLRYTSIPIF